MNPPEDAFSQLSPEQQRQLVAEFPDLKQSGSAARQTFARAFVMAGSPPEAAIDVARAVLSTDEAAYRLQIIREELHRLFPAVCVPDSTERNVFLHLHATDFEKDPEWSLMAAHCTLLGAEGEAPEPWSPKLHPCTLLEQLCYVWLWNVNFTNVPVLEALDFLTSEATRTGEKMRETASSYGQGQALVVRPWVPRQLLEQSVVSGSFQAMSLGHLLHCVAGAAGLSVRAVNGEVVVCSDEMAAAHDGNVRHGFQRPLWELARPIRPASLTLPEKERQGIVRHYPALAVPFSPEQTCFVAHYLLSGTPQTAWELADRLFARKDAEALDDPAKALPPPTIPGIDEAPDGEAAAE